MKIVQSLLSLVFCLTLAFAAPFKANVLEFIAETGFDKQEDRIVEYKFLEHGKKILLLGKKNLQIWDYENGKLLSSTPHEISQFQTGGFLDDLFLSGLPNALAWQPVLIDPQGKWVVTIETFGDKMLGNKKKKLAVVRDVPAMKQIAVLELPNNSVDSVSYDEKKGEVSIIGLDDDNAAIANWKRDSFELRQIIPVDEYKWHQFIQNGEKILIGSGDSKTIWNGLNVKQGDVLTLRDAKTGAIEKEFTAPNLMPRTPFRQTFVTKDEKILLSVRDSRLIIWDIAGNGQPRFEITGANFELYDTNTLSDFVSKNLLQDRYLTIHRDGDLFVYDIKGDGKPKYQLSADEPKDSIRMASKTADGQYIAAVEDEKVWVLKTDSDGKPLYQIVRDSPNERFNAVEITDSHDYLVVTRKNKKEDMPSRTEIYDVKTGKIVREIPETVGRGVKITADEKVLYSVNLGYVYGWSFDKKQSYKISLDTETTNCNYKTYDVTCQAETFNTEYVVLSPNEKFILRYGDNIVSVFETESGKEVQKIFNPRRAKYDKFNKLKKSGLGKADWSDDGRFVYAFDGYDFFDSIRTVSFWRAEK